LTKNRFVAVLEKLTVAAMTTIVGNSIPGEQFSHDPRDGNRTCPEKKMNVIRKEGPSITGSTGVAQYTSETLQETLSVLVVLKDIPAFYAPDHDMMKGSWCINAGLTWHVVMIYIKVIPSNL
jgi:hypothetical protein